jgi:aspartate/methionine/tyrosine aminotransferase
MRFASRIHNLREEGAYRVLAQARALEADGREIIHLEIGEPDQRTPSIIAAAGSQAILDGHTRYTAPTGIPSLREAIAEDFNRRRGASIGAEQVVLSPGTKPMMLLPALALLEPGDEVIYPDPGFPSYSAIPEIAGAVPMPIPLQESRDFSFDPHTLEKLISEQTKLIILNSPSNPTGGVIPESDLETIAKLASRHGIWLLSDEIYSQIVYENESSPSLISHPEIHDQLIIADGFSKTYAMTGWRLGYGIMPIPLAQKMNLLLTHSIGSTAHFTQIAGLEALRSFRSQIPQLVEEYRKRRDVLIAGLNAIPGVTCKEPAGAFYAFANITKLGKSSREIADLILHEAGVAVLPGSDFGANGEGYLRISYANSLENIERGLDRISQVLEM